MQLNLPNSSITYKNPHLGAIFSPRKIESEIINTPTSPERLAANAANAQHSTRPRTPEGHARSSQNARAHGLTARDALIASDEREEFNDYQTDVKPHGAIQQSLFDDLVAAAWNLRRIRRLEVRACSDTTQTAVQLEKDLDRLVRYKTCIERTFHRSLKELKSVANQRRDSGNPATQCASKYSNAEQRNANYKQTQHFEKRGELGLLKALLEAPPALHEPPSTDHPPPTTPLVTNHSRMRPIPKGLPKGPS